MRSPHCRAAFLAGCLVVALAAPGRAQQAEIAPAATPSVDELIAALSSPDAAARITAVRTLGESGAEAAVVPLTGVVRNDPVPEVRGWAVRSLYQIGTPEARAAVVTTAQQDPDERVRGMAARLTGVAATPAQPAPPSVVQTQPVAPQTTIVAPVVEAPVPRARPPRPPGRGLRLGGWITTGVTYGLALLVGAALMSVGDDDSIDWGWKFILPIVGPAVAMVTNLDGEDRALSVWGFLWSAGEALGVILLAVGYTRGQRAPREEAASRPPAGLAVLPGGPGGLPGLSLAGWFR
jgi:hypothetical protein